MGKLVGMPGVDVSTVASCVDFDVDLDIVDELIKNRSDYTGCEKSITIYNMSRGVESCIDILRAQVQKVSGQHKPGRNPTYACAIHGGLTTLKDSECVQQLVDIKQRLDTCDTRKVDRDDYLDAHSWFSCFKLGLPNDEMSDTIPKTNISVHDDTPPILSRLANEMGCSSSVIAAISMYTVLRTQEALFRKDRDTANRVVDVFMSKVRRRVKIAAVFVDTIEAR